MIEIIPLQESELNEPVDWVQHWTLSTWENAEEQLSSIGLFAVEKSHKRAYVSYDDNKNSLQLRGCWFFAEYVPPTLKPLCYHVKRVTGKEL